MTTTDPQCPPAPVRVSHVTVPCLDLGVAEEFYVELLGFQVVSRIDAARRATMGWPADAIDAKSADHLGVVLDGAGTRLDLFEYPAGVPSAAATKHPHIGLAVAPEAFPTWAARLRAVGVVVAGPRRLGPPGQASIYFDDPSGNHLEIETHGVDTEGLPLGGPGDTSMSYAWAGLN